jgi:hypothetical protein
MSTKIHFRLRQGGPFLPLLPLHPELRLSFDAIVTQQTLAKRVAENWTYKYQLPASLSPEQDTTRTDFCTWRYILSQKDDGT